MPFVNTLRGSTSVSFKRKGGPKVPGAPTIGTASYTSSTTASVPFTAPSSDGGSVIISYTATSSPGGITGTLTQAGSGTITISGLTTGTAYTFTVTATNAIGTGSPSAASNSVTPVLQIGDAYQGGFYAGQISTSGNGVATHNLVVASKSGGVYSNAWILPPATGPNDPGSESMINGPQNTADIRAIDGYDPPRYPCHHFCDTLTLGGYSDWYMPAFNEMELCYYNLKPSTTPNSIYYGGNANAVPARSGFYTAGDPPQTSATIFRTGNAQAFGVNNSYYSSTEGPPGEPNAVGGAKSMLFSYGAHQLQSKWAGLIVQAVRRVAV